jgi:hypothetical protein
MRASLIAAAAAVVHAQPEQVHLSLTGSPTSIAVDFVAPAAATAITASYGSPAKAAAVNCVKEALNTFQANWCTAVFGGLAANTVYTYQLTADGKVFTANFTNQPASRDPVFAVYADFGLGNDESLNALIADSEAGGFDYVIHAGVR